MACHPGTPTLPSLLPRLLLGYAIGAIGGAVFAWAHLPLPWLIGSLVAVALARLAGAPAAADNRLRNAGFAVVGLALGLYFTPAAAARVASHLPLVLGAGVLTLVIAGVFAWALVRLLKLDVATAWFAAMPGGAADMAMLADAYGGRGGTVAVMQLIRVVVVVIAVPYGMVYLGAGSPVPPGPLLPFHPLGFLALLAIGLVLAYGLVRLGFRAGWMLAPLALSLTLTATDHVVSGVPGWVSAMAQVTLGTPLGAAFDRPMLRRVRGIMPPAFAQAVLLILACSLCGLLLALLAGESAAALVLGLAPGGVAEMCLTAKLLDLDVPLVVGFQVARVFLVLLLTAPLFRLLQRIRLQKNRT